MSLLDRLGETQLGLGGVRPANLPSSKNTSRTHAIDPVQGKRGDEKVSFNSEYDRDGVTPERLPSSLQSSNTHIDSFDSKYDLDGKTPETSPFASKTSPTHVIDPDAIKDIQNDPILGKSTKVQKMIQGIRRSNNKLVAESNFDLDGKTPTKLSSAFRSSNTHVQDPNANDPTDINLSRDQVLANRTNNVLKAKSDFDLDGKTPNILSSAFRSSNTHVEDPNANDPTDVNLSREQVLLNRKNNVLKAQSNFDLDGKTPSTLASAFGTSNTHVNDPNATIGELVFQDTPRSTVLNRRTNNTVTFDSRFDLDGKTPSILPSATRGSTTHVYDPDFSINQINDPLLSLRGSELKSAQDSRRANNSVMFKSALGLPPEGRLGTFTPSRPYDIFARSGRGGSNFELRNTTEAGSSPGSGNRDTFIRD